MLIKGVCEGEGWFERVIAPQLDRVDTGIFLNCPKNFIICEIP